MKNHLILALSFAIAPLVSAQAGEVLKCVYHAHSPQDSLDAYVAVTADGIASNVVFSNPNREKGDKVLAHFRADHDEIGFDDQGIQLKNEIQKEELDSINENEIILGAHLDQLHDFHLKLADDHASATLRADFRIGQDRAEPIFVELTCTHFLAEAPASPEKLHQLANQDTD